MTKLKTWVLGATAAACTLLLFDTAMDSRTASAQEADEELVAFGQQVASLLQQSDIEALVDLIEPQQVECPQVTPGGDVHEVCEGVDEGETISAYLTARRHSDAAPLSRERVVEGLAAARDEFETDDFRLYTVSLDGHDTGSHACPECSTFVISTPPDTQMGDEAGTIFEFQAIETAKGFRIYSFAHGAIFREERAMLEGGDFEGHAFILVEDEPAPEPPATGTGLVERESVSSPCVALVVVAAVALLGSVRVALTMPRRSNEP